MKEKLTDLLFKKTPIAPLIIFRVIFGLVLLFSTTRTLQKGWVKELYIDPIFHFPFLSWAHPFPELGMYVVFLLMILAGLGITLGFLYKSSVLIFFLLFTYIELLDKTYYLNHYYLVSLLTFWLFFVPANRWYSIDAFIKPSIASDTCSNWHILIFKSQLSIVYFFAGLAKVNPDWLFRAQPMATWLPGKYELPLIGKIMHLKQTAYFFSWAGCMYDLLIWIFLWIKKTRTLAYIAVIIFHVLTGILFPRIGMFPVIMICSTIIFFSPQWHRKVLSSLPFHSGFLEKVKSSDKTYLTHPAITAFLIIYIAIQLYLPFRYLQYPGNLFWHERGYRFSWRVMLMEKNGLTSIIVKDPIQNIQYEVNQDEYLTPFQKQQMKTQPDMILQFARHIGDEFKKIYGYPPQIFVKSRLSLNARRSQPFTDETMDVYSIDDPIANNWIIDFKE